MSVEPRCGDCQFGVFGVVYGLFCRRWNNMNGPTGLKPSEPACAEYVQAYERARSTRRPLLWAVGHRRIAAHRKRKGERIRARERALERLRDAAVREACIARMPFTEDDALYGRRWYLSEVLSQATYEATGGYYVAIGLWSSTDQAKQWT